MSHTSASTAVARSHRLTILNSLTYLAVEAENWGDQSLATQLRSTFFKCDKFARRVQSSDSRQTRHERQSGFSARILAADPQLQDAILTLLDH